jgi:hypothetical protein
LQANARLNIAYLLREQFEQLWDYADADDAKAFFDAWRDPHESPHFLKATQFCRGGSRNGSLTNRRGSRDHAGYCATD